jgi:hypothetical protein
MNSNILKFNSKLYSSESIKQAINEYQKTFKEKKLFSLKRRGLYFELELKMGKYPENFVKDFSNYALYLNCK